MDRATLTWICSLTGATSASAGERIQSLWSGYGSILRLQLNDGSTPSVVVKQVRPGGRRGDRGHQRKLRSYAVEMAFYRDWAERCGSACRVPTLLGARDDDGWLFVLEDLDAVGFGERRGWLSDADIERCLSWLAAFHATFLGEAPAGLWPIGTYWHLATRPDELAATEDGQLKAAAASLDERLNLARFQTLVHGDAKVANFCFGPAGVAAVDFQYVGGGCGMKDLAYFLGSCLGSRSLAVAAPRFLDRYFELLRVALAGRDLDLDALEAEWRALYPVAWADFERFLAGWAPNRERPDAYTKAMIREALRGG